MALMPSEAEVGGRAQEEVVEIQVGGVERVMQAATQAECFDLARKTRERLRDTARARGSPIDTRTRSPLSASTTSTSPSVPARHLAAAENLHRGYVHGGRGEQSQPARDRIQQHQEVRDHEDLAGAANRDQFARERRREIELAGRLGLRRGAAPARRSDGVRRRSPASPLCPRPPARAPSRGRLAPARRRRSASAVATAHRICGRPRESPSTRSRRERCR